MDGHRLATPSSVERSVTAATLPTNMPATRIRYLVAASSKKNRENMTGRINGWKAILRALTVHFGDRVADHIQ